MTQVGGSLLGPHYVRTIDHPPKPIGFTRPSKTRANYCLLFIVILHYKKD